MRVVEKLKNCIRYGSIEEIMKWTAKVSRVP